MKILVDMNLSPRWVPVLERHGWGAVHWSAVGDGSASDRAVMEWAAAHGYIVFTHDLDFGAMLAATEAVAPSVVQVRTQDVLPERLEHLLMAVLTEQAAALESGALVVVDETRARVRILPLQR